MLGDAERQLDPTLEGDVVSDSEAALARIHASRYDVSVVPPESPDAPTWTLTVEDRGHGLWAVCWGSMTMNRNGRMVVEPQPSSRSQRYLKAHRFDLATALMLARREAPKLTINSISAAEVRRRWLQSA